MTIDLRRIVPVLLTPLLLTPLLLTPAVALADEQPAEEKEEKKEEGEPMAFEAKITGELGFLDPLSHKIQFGRDNREFDYVGEGGQDVLFSFQRISAEFEFAERHHAILLYQPLALEAKVVTGRDVTFDDTTFPEGTAIDVRYQFPFYRASYLYDLDPTDKREISIGASLQLRNATIDFTSVDGSLRQTNRDVGPVPIIKFRAHIPLGETYWFEGEVDGFYAPVSYINGDNNDVIGAIADVSVRAGRPISPTIDAFVNFRYLGGGAQGVSPDDVEPGVDGFTENWLHFATISLGFSWTFANQAAKQQSGKAAEPETELMAQVE